MYPVTLCEKTCLPVGVAKPTELVLHSRAPIRRVGREFATRPRSYLYGDRYALESNRRVPPLGPVPMISHSVNSDMFSWALACSRHGRVTKDDKRARGEWSGRRTQLFPRPELPRRNLKKRLKRSRTGPRRTSRSARLLLCDLGR